MRSLFPRWLLPALAVSAALLVIAIGFVWLLKSHAYADGNPLLPRHILIPILFGLLGAVCMIATILFWIIGSLVPFLSLIWHKGWKIGLLIYKREHCTHTWVLEPSNHAKRHCSVCGREQWVIGKPHPRIGEPAYEWKDSNFDELRYF